MRKLDATHCVKNINQFYWVKLILLFVSFFTITISSKAQAPIITKTSGYPIGANIPCYGIAYGASKYVSITSTGDIYTSTDGTTWIKSASLGKTLNN